MNLRLQPIQVATWDADQERRPVFHNGFLVAVLVRLSAEYEDEAGKWFLEVGFGRVNTATPPTFANLDEAQGWIEQRLARSV